MTALRLSSGALFLALCTAALPLLGGTPAAPPPPADADVLDFLADWQGDDGQWVDPMTFMRIDPAKVAADESRRHGKAPVTPPAVGTSPGTQPAGTVGRRAR
ncbi:MAG TPA: hypothetical protein VKT74_01390 [Gammaproteobacteria bacterium]|nr:hypothetical protein [Gammaproteobacteria bacterium]